MALLQIQEPQKEIINSNSSQKIVIGIDLGTTNSLVGVIENNCVRLFSDENGNDLHNSIVGFDADGNVVAVGNEAIVKNCAEENYILRKKNILQISSIKRLMGKSFSDVKDIDGFYFDDSSASHNSVRLVVGNKKYSPEEISAEILKYLKELAEKKLNLEKLEIEKTGKFENIKYDNNTLETLDSNGPDSIIKITQAVITVPAYFDEAAKNATKLAAQLAGLEVLRLVNEPTAAALAYGLDNSIEGIYAVYDFGGGTFDVSILKMQQGVFKVLGVSGDNALGGDDLDELMARKIQEKAEIDFIEAKIIARKIKEELSSKNAVEIDISSLNGNFKFSISRLEFEELIAKKIDKTISLATKLVEDLNLETLDIKGVIMVGGSSRIPLIRQKLTTIFGAEKILTNLDPDRVVAIGAAWQAFNLSGNASENHLLLDVIPLSLGIEMMGGIVDKIILRNTTIPALVTKEFTTYADNQNGMKLHIVQGEREFAKDCRSLAQFEIKNIPSMKAGMARITVSFKVDADGLLTVTAKEKISEQKQEIIVKPSYGIDENEVKKMLIDSMKNAASDIQNRLLAQTISDSQQTILILKNDLEEFGALISLEEKNVILEKLSQLEKLLDAQKNYKSQNTQQTREFIASTEKELEKAAENLVLQKVNHSLKMFVGKKA